MCYYCHVRRKCRRLQRKNRRFHSSQYQKSLKSTSTSITTFVESSKTNTCFISSSSTWVIDFGATDHMTDNSSLFTTFQPHFSRTIHLTPLITLTPVPSLPQFSFNLIFVSKLTRTLNCSVSFFPNYCLIQDLLMKQIIGRGRESGGLYILDTKVPKSLHPWVESTACFFINRMPSSVLNWTAPYHQLFLNNRLFPIDPKVFGCTCFVRDVRPQVSKLDPKSLKCIFVGYSHVKKGYRCYCPTLRRYFVSADVTFFETTPFSLLSNVTS